MRDWIAGIVAVLGVLLVLAGATMIVLRAVFEGRITGAGQPPVPDGPTGEVPVVVPNPAPVSNRLVRAFKETTEADRLILWGIVLLVLSAVAAGAITFDLAGGNK